MASEIFYMSGHEFIKLGSLLKASGNAMTGGAAKDMIASGEVSLNGEICLERGNDWNQMKFRIKDEVAKYVNQQTKRKPMIVPIIMEVE